MKKILIASFAALVLTGCASKQVLMKTTVFGFNAQTPSISGAGAIVVQIGLIRSEYISNPTGTNQEFAAPLTSHVQANLNPLTQSATEDIGTK